MGARAVIAGTAERIAKRFGPGLPPDIQAGEDAAQMGPDHPFSPGEPVRPYDGYSRTPRSFDYQTSYNVATRPRTHERVSFDVLKNLIGSYDVAEICCVPGTEIITKRGLIPIENVVAGDEVITHLGRWRRVTRTMVNQPHEPVRTLKTSAFEDLSVTGNHPVWAVDYGLTQTNRRFAKGIDWVSADKLRPRGPKSPGNRRFDGLVLPALAFPDGRPVLDVAAALGAGYTAGPEGLLARTRGGRLTGVPARVAMDATLGRLLGWYMAEGSQGHGRDINFTLGAGEGKYAEQILADAEAVFGLKGTARPVSYGASIGVLIHSTILGSLFSCGRAKTKRLPDWAWDGGREFFAALLEAWALGDGCRSVRSDTESPRIMVATSSRDLAWQMRMVAIALGISACVVTLRNRDKYDAVIRGRRLATSPVQYHVTWREKPQRWGRESFEFDGRYLSTALVTAERSDYNGPVYNLEVDEDESYVTTGGTVHNCIWHRIDSIRSLKHKLIAADNYSGDITGAIPLGMAALRKPDRKQYFKTWLAKYLYDILAYDAGTLYRMRNRGGKCIGMKTVDGTMIAPLLDYWGDSPEAPAEAYVQYANGLPWNWLTRNDLVYEPYRPHTDSPYGHAPIESIILNANTDLRFQVYFLERYTAGNIPEAFASAPEGWSPDQIEQFQALWDSIMYGDQSQKHQIKWMPGGSTLAWSNEKEFTDSFSLHLMRKTCSAFHVVPSDLGFTENSNRSTGESQADVQHRVGDLPLMEHVEGILSAFLQDDLGLPLKLEFDRGEEQDDQLDVAHSDDVYIKNGVIGASEVREMRFGLTEPEGQQVPRFIFTTRAGPIPLSSLMDVAGPLDAENAAPLPGSPLPHNEFELVEGVVPVPAPKAPALAERLYGEAAVPAAPAPGSVQPTASDVTKEATTGVTAGTGITSYDLDDDDEDEDDDREDLAKAEMAAFRRFEKGRRRAGEWRDFSFTAVEPEVGRVLNQRGRVKVVKAGDARPKVKEEAPGLPETIRPAVVARRSRMRRKHLRAVAAAWDVCVASLDAGAMVRDFREDAGLVAKAASTDQDWWKRAATAAALAWLAGIGNTSGYPALVAAVEDAIRSGMAEGQADALAAAAAKQGGAGVSIAAAFGAAYTALEGDPAVTVQAEGTIERIVAGAGDDIGRTLTDMAGDGASAGEMTSAAVDAVTGTGARALVSWIGDAIQAAIGDGAVALWSQQAQVQDAPVLVSWENDGAPCLNCQDYAAGGPYLPQDLPSYPAHPNCVIGSTRVALGVVAGDEPDRLTSHAAMESAGPCGDGRSLTAAAAAEAVRDFGRGDIRAVVDRDYVGDVVTIRTALGHELTATPNHPIATRRGWVPVAELAVGDHVLSSTGREWEAVEDPDVDNIPPRVEQVAQSFPVVLDPMPSAPQYFHGDGAGSDVYVVRAGRLLAGDGKPGVTEHVREREFSGRDVRVTGTEALDAESLGGQKLGGLGLPSHGVVGGVGVPGALLGRESGHTQISGLAAAARLNAGLEQPAADRSPADAEGFCERLFALTPGIAADEIVYVNRDSVSTHVYNLVTAEGWFIGNGIITHNCQCELIEASTADN